MVMGDMEMTVDIAIIGSGPGGYGAAFRAADLGLDVALVDSRPELGGVCLHAGCIPSKTYLFLADLILESRKAKKMGVCFSEPEIDIVSIQAWKDKVVGNLSQGLTGLSDRRGVQRITAKAHFESSTTVRLEGTDINRLHFQHAIIATGSRPIVFPGTSPTRDSRIMSSTGALAMPDIPGRLLIIGGGYVGLEIGTIYAALGSRIWLAERELRLLSGVDQDLVQPLKHQLDQLFEHIWVGSTITSLKDNQDYVEVRMETEQGSETHKFDRVLVAIGRKPFSEHLGLEHTEVKTDNRGYIIVDDQQRTNDEHIFAVGDVAGEMMLAHTATRQGRVAAEVIGGQPSRFDVRAIPSVVYTVPQIAWCGLSEEQAREKGIAVHVQKFPWKFSGRAHTMDATEGFTKILADPADGRILGLGVCGHAAEGLVAEGVLAIEMGALAEDLALSLHPHPTLSETQGETAELFLGSPTHILPRKSKQH
jgi:dihydrolipoamide dehydrogenase